MGFIYRLEFSSGKSYIGYTKKTAEQRFKEHATHARLGSKNKVHRAWRKYGCPILHIIGKFENSELPAKEIEFISRYNSYENGYNMTLGGESCPSSLPEVKASSVLKMKATKALPENKQRRAEKMKGNKNSLGTKRPKEQMEKLSSMMKGNKRTSGLIWITNGTKSKRVPKSFCIEGGWRRGRK